MTQALDLGTDIFDKPKQIGCENTMTDAALSNVISAMSGVVGAIVGGLFTVWGTVHTLKKTSQDLESAEIRRQKVECLVSLMGLRFVIGGVPVLDEYKSRFTYEMNKVPILWVDDPEAMKSVRDFRRERNNHRFIVLLRSLSRTTTIPIEMLSDEDLEAVSLLPLSGH